MSNVKIGQTGLRIYKSFSERGRYYAFHWIGIDEHNVHIYDYDNNRWCMSMDLSHFLQIKAEPKEEGLLVSDTESADWDDSSLLDVLVVTGWTEMSVLKAILDNVPDGWKKLHRNLYIASLMR